MYINTKGLILKEARYKEADRIITLFTEKCGKITVSAHGALSKRSKYSASTQSLTYSDFVLDYRKGKYSVKEATVSEYFTGLRTDITKYSLACYFCDAVDVLSIEEASDVSILRIILNALYALSNDLFSQEQIKAAFELKLISAVGFQPDVDSCCVCGAEDPEEPVFLIENGRLCCRKCHTAAMGFSLNIDESVLRAMRFILSSNLKNYISFRISEDNMMLLSRVCESFFLEHTDRRFSTLDYWKSVK
ncbi:MAG: DNA repair protein RecO [Oscillospiraceae bacterium]|nr:DNA repair protein RecO [Oscillospiraceae bacterium]